jgi:hypothetical protein
MSTTNHPITPPLELVQQWREEAVNNPAEAFTQTVATRAAQWGADQELEACCEHLVRRAQWEPEDVDELRTSRRPKPPSLKEQARSELIDAYNAGQIDDSTYDTIRRALQALPE